MANVRIVPATKTPNTLHEGYSYDLVGEQIRAARFDRATAQWVDLTRATLSTAEQLALQARLNAKHPLPVPRAPEPTPTPATSRCRFGIVGTPDWPSMLTKSCQEFSPTLVRLDMARMGSTAQQDAAIKAIRAQGAEPIVLVSNWSTSTAPQTARAIVDRFGPVHVEWGNETSLWGPNGGNVTTLKATATKYALSVKAAAAALAGTGARLLVQADGGLWAGSTWADSMYAAVPNLHDLVYAWTVHPYTLGRQVEQVQQLVDATGRHGCPPSKPIFVTEAGVASDDGRRLRPKETKTLADGTVVETVYGYSNRLSYELAADALTVMHRLLTSTFPQIEAFCVYCSIDLAGPGSTEDPEAFFGGLLRGSTLAGVKVEGQLKPFVGDALKAISAASLKTTG